MIVIRPVAVLVMALALCGLAPRPDGVAAVRRAPSPRSVYDAMTPAQRIGQLFMVGVPSTGASPRQLARLRQLDVGNVVLDGDSSLGVARTATVTSAIAAGLAVDGVEPFVSTDQEGGEVQRLSGPGFSTIPSALRQGKRAPARLRADWKTWSAQLAKAGVTVDLAPVADTVPASESATNQPIGRYHREYGHTPAAVAPHVAAVVRGQDAAGVVPTVKHFPGLGRATGDTDTSANVTDPTSRHDSYVEPFAAGVRAGAGFVMVSFAKYPRIDRYHLACFSATVMRGMLRHDLRFGGVIMSDSFNAAAVRDRPAGAAAISFLRAGGTMLLDTESRPIHAMEQALRRKAGADPRFAAVVKAAVMHVLRAKAAAGILGS